MLILIKSHAHLIYAKAEIFSQQYIPHNETHTITKYPAPKFIENTLNDRKTKILYIIHTQTMLD